MPRNERPFTNQSRRLIPYKYSEEDLDRAVQTEPKWLVPVYGTLFPKVDSARVLHLMAGSGVELPISRTYFGPSASILAIDNNSKEFDPVSGLLFASATNVKCDCMRADLRDPTIEETVVNRLGGRPQSLILRHPQLFLSLTSQVPIPGALDTILSWIDISKRWGAQMLLTLQDESESDAIETELKRAKFKTGQDFRRLKLPDTPPLYYKSGTAHLDRYCKLFP